MRNNKYLLFIMCTVFALIFSGCGTETPTTKTASESTNTDSKEQNETSEDENKELKADGEKAYKLSFDTTIDETVLLDDETVKITAKGLRFEYNSPIVTMEFINNSEKDLSFISGSIGYSCNSINDYMSESLYMNVDVPAGETVAEDLYINADELRVFGITHLKEIGIAFSIKDKDYNEYLTTGPLFISTSDADVPDDTDNSFLGCINGKTFEDETGFSKDFIKEEELFASEDMRALSYGLLSSEDGEKIAFIEMENLSDKQLIFTTSDIEVNENMLSEGRWNSTAVNPGKKAVVYLEINSIAKYAEDSVDMDVINNIEKIGFIAGIKDFNMNDLSENKVEIILSD